MKGKLLIVGDFNVHMENEIDPDRKKFNSMLEKYGLKQHIKEPTHIGGGTLDIVITRTNVLDSLQLKNIEVTETVTTSDHFLISLNCDFEHQSMTQNTLITTRCVKKINIDVFGEIT